MIKTRKESAVLRSGIGMADLLYSVMKLQAVPGFQGCQAGTEANTAITYGIFVAVQSYVVPPAFEICPEPQRFLCYSSAYIEMERVR